jgi:RNA polymerase sigma-70 factor, ECF subfamily
MSVNTSKHPTDQGTFQHLYNQYRSRLLGSVLGMVKDEARAEDITAATFQIAWEKRAQFRAESSLYTWLYAIASNEARRSWREDRRTRLTSIDQTNGPKLVEPVRQAEERDRTDNRLLLSKALNRIPAKYRRVLTDHFVNGHSIQHIARRERIPSGTVLSRIFTAKRLLRKAWAATT